MTGTNSVSNYKLAGGSNLSLEQLSIESIRTPRLVKENLEDWLRRLTLCPEFIYLHTRFMPTHFCGNKCHDNDLIELDIFSWLKGQETTIHAHDGNLAAVKVIKGEIRSRLFPFNMDENRIKTLKQETILRVGEIGSIGADEAHQLICTSDEAITIHIYARPLKVVRTFKSISDTGVFYAVR